MTYLRIYNIRATRRVSIMEQELLTIQEYLGFPSVSSIRAAHFVLLLSLHVPFCDVRYDFRVKWRSVPL